MSGNRLLPASNSPSVGKSDRLLCNGCGPSTANFLLTLAEPEEVLASATLCDANCP